MSARTLKIRSEQNGTYSKRYLTRMRFVLPSDLMMTDAGNSYLSLQTSLLNADGTNVETKQAVTGSEYYFSFGDGVQPYSASCIFRTAKLFSQMSGAVIEEINFSNLKTASFEALQADIDTLGASTSFSGASLSTEVIKNIQSNYSIWTEGNKQELHIRLKDLFPSLNTAVYSLKQSPLIVDLEMEVTRDLIMKMTALDSVQEPPATAASGDALFISGQVSNATCLVESQVNELYKGVQTPNNVIRPDSWEYLSVNYGEASQEIYVRDAAGNTAPVGEFQIDKLWSDADATAGGFIYNQTPVIMTQSITNGAGDEVQSFQHLMNVTGITPDATTKTTQLIMSVDTQAVINTYEQNEDVKLVSFNPTLISKSGVNGFQLQYNVTNEAAYNLLRDDRKYVLTQTDRETLVSAGILKLNAAGEHELIPDVDFNANLRLTVLDGTGADHVIVASDFIHAHEGTNYLVSNSSAFLPRRESKRLLFSSFDHATSTIEFSEDLKLSAGDGENALGFYHINSIGGVEAATSFVLFITNVAPVADTQDRLVGNVLTGAYPEISKAEIVLKQYPAGNMKMPSLYRTMRVEPFNIPNGFSEFVNTFQIEGNCYNAYVVLPNSDSSSLMSTGKNVGSYRATIDEVDLTNVDVRISGSYPSTLYFDRLVDTFSNSQMQLRNLEGIATGVEAGKIRIIPIKIYSGMVNGSPILSPSMKRLQIRLIAEIGKLIQGGTAYLYKELYREY